jgi:class 3 adenylate cyclase/pimeloyl-ACP methyl ester carboxylesterase
VDAPEVRYARSGGANIAYQVVGDGPIDLLYVPGWISHLDLYWQEPTGARYLRRLAAAFRLILFDRRGTGLSDRDAGDLTTLDGRLDDARAVLDAAGSERAAVFAQGLGCPFAIVLAASCPERTRALVLYNAVANSGPADDDYPWGPAPEELEAWLAHLEEGWGTEELAREWLSRLAPSAAGDPRQIAWNARLMRASANPAAFRRTAGQSAVFDVRDLLPLVSVPTLVLQREDVVWPKGGKDVRALEESRYVADRIPGAKLVTLPGQDFLPWIGDQEALVGEVLAFVTGTRAAVKPDRVLLTVLFADIVDSTGVLARLGDERWKALLTAYEASVRAALDRHRGLLVEQTGDGVFATFDGPGRAVRCADELTREARRLGLELRAGVHTGEIELVDGRLSGIAVHIGARIMGEADAGEVLVSGTVRDLVAGSGLDFAERGTRELRGVPGEWRLFALVRR